MLLGNGDVVLLCVSVNGVDDKIVISWLVWCVVV